MSALPSYWADALLTSQVMFGLFGAYSYRTRFQRFQSLDAAYRKAAIVLRVGRRKFIAIDTRSRHAKLAMAAVRECDFADPKSRKEWRRRGRIRP